MHYEGKKGKTKRKREAKKEVDTSECQTVGWVWWASLFGRARGDTPVSSLYTHTHIYARPICARLCLVTPPALPIFRIHTHIQPRWQRQTVSRSPQLPPPQLCVPFLPITFHPAPPRAQGSIEDDSEDWMAVTEKAKTHNETINNIEIWGLCVYVCVCLWVCVSPYGSSVMVSVSLSWQVIINTLY